MITAISDIRIIDNIIDSNEQLADNLFLRCTVSVLEICTCDIYVNLLSIIIDFNLHSLSIINEIKNMVINYDNKN